MTTTLPKKINPTWLKQQQTKLGCTAQLVGGQPNPNYAALAAEIAEAETEMSRWAAFEAWCKDHLGAILNQYPMRANGQSFEAGKVFFCKDKATGRVTTWTRDEAWKIYQDACE